MALEDRAVIVSPCPTPRPAESTSPAARRAVIPALNSRSRPGPTYSFSCPRVRERRCRRGAVDGAPFSTGVPCPITQALIGCAGESPFDRDGATFLVAEFAKPLPQCVQRSKWRRHRGEHADSIHFHAVLRRADERRNDDAPTHDGDER